MKNAPCPAARDLVTPCVSTDGDGHAGLCTDGQGNEWTRESSWFTPEAQQTDDDDLSWL